LSAKSLFIDGRNCWRHAQADRVAFLVDGAAYFDAFAQAALRAQKSIIILGWDFHSEIRLWCDDKPRRVPAVLGDFLNFLIRRNRRLRVYILDWDFPMIFGTEREFPPLFGLGWRHRRRIHLRFDNAFPVGASHHQKIVVIDDAMAFSGGMDFAAGRWDTPEHMARDPRRTVAGKVVQPVHDLMMALDGEAAFQLARLAKARWCVATGKKLRRTGCDNNPWPEDLEPDVKNVHLAISRTAPAYEDRPQIREIEALFLDMIAAAKQSIYIECQYFTAARVEQALERRLQEENGPEILVVVRNKCDGWLEHHVMGSLRTRLVNRLRAADRNGRFHVYYPVVPDLGDECVNIHAKLMIVDHEWLRIGSANLSNRSMGLDTECDLTLEARGDVRVAQAIAGFRNRLLAEHLGSTQQQVAQAVQREGSLAGAIAALTSGKRKLEPLVHLEEWPEQAVSVAEILDPERPVAPEELIEEVLPDLAPEHAERPWFKILAVALILVGFFAAWRYTPLKDMVTVEAVTDWVEAFREHPAAPFALMGAYIIGSMIMFPRPLLTLAAVVAFGPWLGFGYALAGILAAALTEYTLGRTLGRETIRSFAGPKINQISKRLQKRGLIAVIAVRLVPVAPFIVVNLVAGATHIRLWHFALGSAIGTLPGVLAMSVFGEQVQIALNDPSKINYWVIAAVIVVMAIGAFAVRRWLNRPSSRLEAGPVVRAAESA
jgi:phospholipase D1/2